MFMSNPKTLTEKKKFTMPHIYVLLFSIIVIAALASWVLPAGEFERVVNDAGRTVVVPGTYATVESSPVGLFQMFQCIYNGMVDGAGVILFVFVSYASIGLIISSGAFNGLIAGILRRTRGNARLMIIPLFMALLGAISSTIGCFEELLPFIPIFVTLAVALGYDALVGMSIVALGVGLGYSGAAMNPFTVGIAQDIAELTPLSGAGFRIFCHAVMIAVASAYVIRYGMKIQKTPTASLVYGETVLGGNASDLTDTDALENHPFGTREKLVLLTLVVGIGVIVWGAFTYGWYFTEMSACFMIIGLVSAIIMGWSPNTIGEKLATSFSDIAMACMMIGFARGILSVLTAGNIIDTVVYGLSLPLTGLPTWLAGEAMLIVQSILNFLVPSGSGQATISMPIMTALSDVLGVSRQVAVLAFQMGDGLSNTMWPTAFAPVIAGLAGVKLSTWWKWYTPLFLLMVVTQMALIAVAVAIGF